AHRSCAACRPCRRAPPGWARGRLLLGTGVISPSCQPHEWLPRQRPPFPQLRLPPRPHRSQLSRRWRSERRGAVMGGWGAAGGTSPGRAGRRGRWGMSLSLVFLAGWWSACARHDSGDVTRSAPTGGAEGSGGDAPVEPSEPAVEASCPSTEPVPSSACDRAGMRDRKSTRLNSSHVKISYAVFCLNVTPAAVSCSLSLRDALPISRRLVVGMRAPRFWRRHAERPHGRSGGQRW